MTLPKAKADADFEQPSLGKKEAFILEMMLMNRGDDLYGLEMVEASNGMLKRGTIYVTLQRLEDRGFIESRTESRTRPEVGIPRRLYRITGQGARIFKAHLAARTAARLVLEGDIA